MNKLGPILCTLGAVLILVSGSSGTWRQGEISLAPLPSISFQAGLRDVTLCSPIVLDQAQDPCRTMSVTEMKDGDGIRGPGKMYLMISLFTYVLAFFAPFALLGSVTIVWHTGVTKAARWGGFVSAGYMIGALLTAVAWTGLDSSMAWGFYTALAGGLAGVIGAGYLIVPALEMGDSDLDRALATLSPSTQQGPTGPYGPDPTRRTQRVDPPRHPTRLETEDGMLRFVVRKFQLEPHAIGGTYRKGNHQVDLNWDEVVRVESYTLPVDPPFEGRTFVDLIGGNGVVFRLMATSRGNYGALPGGAGQTSLESLRRLAQHVCDRGGLSVSPDLQTFLAGQKPVRFNSVNGFLAYDAALS